MTINRFQFLMFSLLAAIVIIPPLLSSSLRPTYIYLIINIAIISLVAEAGLLSRSVRSTNKSPAEDNYDQNNYFVAPKQTQEALTYHHPQASKFVVVPRVVEKSVSEIINLVKVDVVQKCLALPLIVPSLVKVDVVKKCLAIPLIVPSLVKVDIVKKCLAIPLIVPSLVKADIVKKCLAIPLIVPSLVKVDVVKKCLAIPIIPLIPSLFFIGGGDESDSETETETDEEEEESYEEEEEEEDFGGLSGQELFTQTENFIGNFYKQLRMQKQN